MKGKVQMLQKRFLAMLLASAVAMSSVHAPVSAMDRKTVTKLETHYNETIISELQNFCSEGERAEDVLDKLYSQGLVDETGMPVIGGTYEVEGKKLTEEQLMKEAEKHQSGKVVIDGIALKWEEVNALLKAREEIQKAQDFMDTGVIIDKSNEKKYQDSLNSLKAQIMSSGLNVSGAPSQTTFGAGVNHQVRVTVTPNNSTIRENGFAQNITCHVKLTAKQEVPVTFQYRAVSGTGTATGSGEVTIPAGVDNGDFTVTYWGNSGERNGERKFYVQCYDIENALFSGNESGGKSATVPISITKYDAMEYIHTVSKDPVSSQKGKMKVDGYDWTIEGDVLNYEITYEMIQQYVNKWGDNKYTVEFGPAANVMFCWEKKDSVMHSLREDTFSENGNEYYHNYYGTNGKLTGDWSSPAVHSSTLGNFTKELGRRKFATDAKWQVKSCMGFNTDKSWPKNAQCSYIGGRQLSLIIEEVHENVNLTGLSIPGGTFYAGQGVPITATFDEKIKFDSALKLYLADGTVLTPEEKGTTGDSCVFLYNVPIMPSGSIPGITKLEMNGTRSYSNTLLRIPGQSNTVFDIEKAMTDFPGKIVRSNEQCKLRGYKDASFIEINCMLDGEVPAKQWVTEVLTVNQDENGAYRKWIQSNCAEIAGLELKERKDLESGEKVQEALANTAYSMYADPTKYQITEYVKSMYVSVDGGTTRIPLYVVAQLGETTETNEVPVALVAHYKPKLNVGNEDRIDYAELFMDPDVGSTLNYIKDDKEAPLMIGQTSRGIETVYYYQVKHAVFVYPGAAKIVYPTDHPFLSNWSELAEHVEDLVSYHQVYDKDITHAVTDGKDNPDYVVSGEEESETKKYSSVNREIDGEKEILTLREGTEKNAAITTTMYEIDNPYITKPFYVQGDELSLTAEFAEEDFSFCGRDNLIWVSSDESIATVKYPDKYVGDDGSQYGTDGKAAMQIVPTGKAGGVYFTLYALNDVIEGFQPVEVCRSVTLHCEAGKEPFLKIPSASSEQAMFRCLKGAGLDICFSSNVTERNAEEAKKLDLLGGVKEDQFPTEFTIKVFEADQNGNADGKPIYEKKEQSTSKKRISQMRIPEGILNRISGTSAPDYVLTISAQTLGSSIEQGKTEPVYSTLTTTAGISILPQRPSVSLGKQESYSILDTDELTISCEASMEKEAISYTSLSIVDSEGTEVFHAPLEQGKNVFTWKPDAVKGTLKKTYVARASIAAKGQEVPSTDSFMFYVYNHDALDILVNAVNGKNKSGITDKNITTLDNHNKIEELLSKDKKTICLDGEKLSVDSLSKDINLSAVVSINYGDYVWGQISDQISWEVSKKDNEKENVDQMKTPTTLNYRQGGAYSNIKSYSYVSYSPSDNFMAVGLSDGETVIKATQVRTGMSSEITITSKSVKDQFYLFKFLPGTTTMVEYVNGNGETCSVQSDENGELALYEPSGIRSDVSCFSEKDGEAYIGTIANINLVTGEQDISKLQNYPVNNFMLISVAKADLYITDETGAPYADKTVWIRGGVFKNNKYCYTAGLGMDSKHVKDGKEDQEFKTDASGKLTVYFDSTQFYTKEEETSTDRRITTADKLVYKIELKFQKEEDAEQVKQAYEPQIITIDTSVDYNLLAKNCMENVKLRKADNGIHKPVINTQEFYQYERESNLLSNVTNVYGDTNSVGISFQYPKAELVTETLYWGEEVKRELVKYTDRNGSEFEYGMGTVKPDSKIYEVYYQDSDDFQPVKQVNEVMDYPFSDMPVIKTTWTMNKSDINSWIAPAGEKVKGIKSSGETAIKTVFNRKDAPVKELASTFTCSNTSNVDQVNDENINAAAEDTMSVLSHGFDVGGVVGKSIKDKKVKAASIFMNGIEADLGVPVTIIISPTENSKVFHTVIQIGEDASTESSSDVIGEDWNEKKKQYDKEKKSITNVSKGETKNGGSYTLKHQDNNNKTEEKKKEEEKKDPFKRKLGPVELTYGGYLMGNLIYDDKEDEWGFLFVGGGINAGLKLEKELFGGVAMVGPLPFCYNLSLFGTVNMDVNVAFTYTEDNNGTDFLTRIGLAVGIEAFAGIGVDAKFFAIKIGIFGRIQAGDTTAMLNMVNFGESNKTRLGNTIFIKGSVGIRFVLKVLFFSYKTTIASIEYGKEFKQGYWDEINDYWSNASSGAGRKYQVKTLADEIMLIEATEAGLEERDYLKNFERDWEGGVAGNGNATYKNQLETIMTNAYTFAEPAYNDDGSIMVFLSDSDSTELEDTLASYATAENGIYVNKHGIDPVTYVTDQLDNETGEPGADGELDPIYDEDGKVINKYRTTKRTGYGDTNLTVAGTSKFSVAAWVRSQNEVKNDANKQASYEDLSMMMNGSEIYASVWTGSKWSTVRLTENTSPDISPAVASSDRYAVVTWRNVQSSNTENPVDFNVCDNVYARVYDKVKDTWSESICLYNGETGKVGALEAAILEDGTAMAAYVVKTGDDDSISTDSEVMYSTINPDGTLGNCIRITNNDQADRNVQVTSLKWNGEERFILGWYNEKQREKIEEKAEDSKSEDAVLDMEKDIRLQAVDKTGLPCDDFIESIKQAGAEKISTNFRFSKPAGNGTINDLSIVWVETESKEQKDDSKQQEQCFVPNTAYTLSAVRFYQDGNRILVSQPVEMAKMDSGDTIDSFEIYSKEDNVHAVIQSTHYEIDKNDPSTYTVDELEHVTTSEDGKTEQTERVNVYTPVGVTNLLSAVGKFKLCAVEATKPSIDTNDVRMGFTLPVPFTVKNAGIRKINKITVNLAGKEEEFAVSLLPGESTVVNASYDVPEGKIEDISYSIVAESQGNISMEEECSGEIKLNIPEIKLESVHITEEYRKTRTIEMNISSQGTVPLVHSGKKVVIGLYESNPDICTLSGEKADVEPLKTITIQDDKVFALMDAGAYSYQCTLEEPEINEMMQNQFSKEDLRLSSYEIPSAGMLLYARVWVENADGSQLEEEDKSDNMGTTTIHSLIDKYGSNESMSSRIEQKEKEVDCVVTIKNNSFVNSTHGNVVTVLKNQKGKIISKVKQCFDNSKDDNGIIRVAEEDKKEVVVSFTQEDLLEGYCLEDAASGVATYGEVDENASTAKLTELKVSGQHINMESFYKDKVKPVISNQKKVVEENGQKVTKKVKINKLTYTMNQELNQSKLNTFIFAVPENPKNQVKVRVNDGTLLEGTGAQVGNVLLNGNFSTVSATVYGNVYKEMEVLKQVPLVDANGKLVVDLITKRPKVKKQKVYYYIDELGNVLDEDGNFVDLTADDILDYKEIYAQNVSEYVVKLYKCSSGVVVEENKQVKKEDKKINQIFLKAETDKNACKLTWTKQVKADGYLVYGRNYKPGKKSNKFKLLKTIKSGKTLTYTQKKLAEKQWYEYKVDAYKIVKGKKEIIGSSYKVFTYNISKKSKYANPVKVEVKKSSLAVKKGTAVQIKAKAVLPKGKKKKLVVSELRYISSNCDIASVTKTGKVKGKKKGSCYIYVIAQNGMWKKVKVTVK
nr:Ig-like domain-containing protein [uncultured Lachnoclostridium sp.]